MSPHPTIRSLSVTSSNQSHVLDQFPGEPLFNRPVLSDVPLECRPDSPPLPEAVPSPSDRPTTSGRSIFRKSSKARFLSRWISPSSPKPSSSRSTRSSESRDPLGSPLPRYMSFTFSMSGRNLLLWKKDSRSFVRVELESYGSRLIDTAAMLPPSAEAQAVNIRYAAEGNDWIAIVMSLNQV